LRDQTKAVGWVELSLLLRYYQSAQKAKPNKNCENIPGSCWVSLRQPNLRISDRFKFYRSVPDFKEYILIDQYRYYVEQFYQQNNGEWLFKAFESENDDLRLYSVDFQISLLDFINELILL
jgi:hypothetical protein